jgi:hypothetical protein
MRMATRSLVVGHLSVAFAAFIALLAERPVLAAGDKTADVPLKKVVLFNSGLGFFRHDGEIDGDQQIELKFNVDNVNDLLKSMVLEDLGGGRISTVTYSAREPVTRTLKTFAIDLTKNPTLAELLRQIRGEKIQVDAPNPISGMIVGIERRRAKTPKDEVVESDVLNLLTATGLRSIPFDNVQQIQLLDPKLNAELQEALAFLSKAHRNDKKTVTLDFRGQGKRPVRIGYIQDFPVWKTSYRLVALDDGSLFLQGWAIVENTTEQDWTNVNLSLVSGKPISFVQDLYQPLFVERPIVVPELYASLSPRTYDQDLASAEAEFRKAANPEGLFVRRRPANQPQAGGGIGGGGGFGGGAPIGGGGGPQQPAVTSVVPSGSANNGKPPPAADDRLSLERSVAFMAAADNVGELFRYAIDTPVTLARQKSAMLPIFSGTVKGEKLSIYNPAVHPKHPLNGLKLVNSTGLHLMQGPITVFDGGEYAGDARIEDLQPGSERLLSYALDLDTEVAPGPEHSKRSLSAITIAGPTVIETHTIDRTKSYVVKNSGAKTKKVLVEYPIDSAWNLRSPKTPAEKTRDRYRFDVKAESGKPANIEIVEQHTDKPQVAISQLPDEVPPVVADGAATYTCARREHVTEELADVQIRKGIVTESRELRRTVRYIVRNPGDASDGVTVAYAPDPQWKLVSPKAEQSGGFYHFQLRFQPHEPTAIEIVEQRTAPAEVPVARLADERIAAYLNAKSVSREVKAALAELVKRRQALAELVARKAQLDAQIKEVGDEQARIRQNMSQLDRNSELYNRYVKKFGVQEDEVERLRQQIRDVSTEVKNASNAVDERFGESAGGEVVDPFAIDRQAEDRADAMSVPIANYFKARELIVFAIQVPEAMKTFRALHNRNPKSHQEFMNEIIKAGGIKLPDLPTGAEYRYDPEKGELMVVTPSKAK